MNEMNTFSDIYWIHINWLVLNIMYTYPSGSGLRRSSKDLGIDFPMMQFYNDFPQFYCFFPSKSSIVLLLQILFPSNCHPQFYSSSKQHDIFLANWWNRFENSSEDSWSQHSSFCVLLQELFQLYSTDLKIIWME